MRAGVAAVVACATVAAFPGGAAGSSLALENFQSCWPPSGTNPCYTTYAEFRTGFVERDAQVTAALSADGRTAHVHDQGHMIDAQLPECHPVPFDAATCDVRASAPTSNTQPRISVLSLSLGWGDDSVDASEVRAAGARVETVLFDGDDVLLGAPTRDVGEGWDGADRLYGRGGDDFLAGGLERVGGTPGPWPDLLDGGPGNDELRDYAGPATLTGGSGDDLIDGQDRWDHAPDQIDCGAGVDVAHVDADDTVIGCETVHVR